MALGWSGNLDKMVEHHLLVPVLVDAYVLSVREVLDDQYVADDRLFSLFSSVSCFGISFQDPLVADGE